MDVAEDSIHAIIGPNGAGKSTLFSLITGEVRLDSGQMAVFGSDIAHNPVRIRKALGIGRTYQTPNLFPYLTVQESLFLAWSSANLSLVNMASPWMRWKSRLMQVLSTAKLVGLESRLGVQAVNLSHGEQRRLGIGMAVVSDPCILLLDEPGAGLTSSEQDMLADLIRDLHERISLTVLFIDHDVSFVLDLADTVTVMDHGAMIVTGKPQDVRENLAVQEIYYGAKRVENG